MTFLGRLVLAAALAILPAPFAQAQQTSYGALSQAQRIAVIERAVDAGDLDLAQRLLAGSYFDEGDLGYAAALLQARVLRARGDYGAAEALLRRILAERPLFRAVRAELAGLLAEGGRSRAAEGELRLLAETARDPGERRAFEALIDRVGAGSGLRLSGFVSLLADTNINSGTETRFVTLFGLPFAVPLAQQRSSGTGLRLGATALWQDRIARRGTIYAATRVTIDEYRGSLFDRQIADLRLGYRHAQRRGFWAVEATGDRHWRAGAGAERALGWRLVAARVANPRWRLSGELRGGVRRYDANPGGRRELLFGRIKAEHAPREGRLFWAALDMGREQAARQPVTGFDRRRFELGAQSEFGGGLGLGLTLARAFDDYDAPYPGLAVPRADRRWEASVSITHEDVQFGGFQPRVTVTGTRNASNAALHRYDRVETAVTLIRQF